MGLKKTKKADESKKKPVDIDGDTLTPEEVSALAPEIDTEENTGVSFQRLENALNYAANEFNLTKGDYVVNGFKDSKGHITLSLSNEDFDIAVVFKDPDKFYI